MKKIFTAAFAVIISLAAFSQVELDTKTTGQKLNEQYCTGLFKSADGVIFDLEETPAAGAYYNILDWLDGRVAGLRVYKTRSGTRVPVMRNQTATIYVDEQPVTASYLNSLPSSDVAMIKVIRTPFFGNAYGIGGAIAIYTFGVEPEEEEKNGK